MVNKKKKSKLGRFFLPNLSYSKILCISCFTIIFFFFKYSEAVSQNISKYYITSQQEQGVLYFIYPQKGFQNIKSKDELIYDITYLNSRDTLTLNFTYTDLRVLQPDSIALYIDDNSITGTLCSPVSKIYVETSKSKWVYRYGAKFLFEDFDVFVRSQTPPELRLYCQGSIIVFKIKDGKWKKQLEILPRIFDIIKMNKG